MIDRAMSSVPSEEKRDLSFQSVTTISLGKYSNSIFYCHERMRQNVILLALCQMTSRRYLLCTSGGGCFSEIIHLNMPATPAVIINKVKHQRGQVLNDSI